MSGDLMFSKTQYMSMRVGTALVKAVAEHGAPNSFAFSELVGAKDAMWAGRAVRADWAAFCLNVGERAGVRVNLSGGRLHVAAAK